MSKAIAAEQVAELVHEGIRHYIKTVCPHLVAEKPWMEAPEHVRQMEVAIVKAHMETPEVNNAKMNHRIFSSYCLQHGWVNGETYDSEKKTNPHLVPFDELSSEHQKICSIAMSIIHCHMPELIAGEHGDAGGGMVVNGAVNCLYLINA
jgi:hypothetical protein